MEKKSQVKNEEKEKETITKEEQVEIINDILNLNYIDLTMYPNYFEIWDFTSLIPKYFLKERNKYMDYKFNEKSINIKSVSESTLAGCKDIYEEQIKIILENRKNADSWYLLFQNILKENFFRFKKLEEEQMFDEIKDKPSLLLLINCMISGKIIKASQYENIMHDYFFYNIIFINEMLNCYPFVYNGLTPYEIRSKFSRTDEEIENLQEKMTAVDFYRFFPVVFKLGKIASKSINIFDGKYEEMLRKYHSFLVDYILLIICKINLMVDNKKIKNDFYTMSKLCDINECSMLFFQLVLFFTQDLNKDYKDIKAVSCNEVTVKFPLIQSHISALFYENNIIGIKEYSPERIKKNIYSPEQKRKAIEAVSTDYFIVFGIKDNDLQSKISTEIKNLGRYFVDCFYSFKEFSDLIEGSPKRRCTDYNLIIDDEAFLKEYSNFVYFSFRYGLILRVLLLAKNKAVKIVKYYDLIFQTIIIYEVKDITNYIQSSYDFNNLLELGNWKTSQILRQNLIFEKLIKILEINLPKISEDDEEYGWDLIKDMNWDLYDISSSLADLSELLFDPISSLIAGIQQAYEENNFSDIFISSYAKLLGVSPHYDNFFLLICLKRVIYAYTMETESKKANLFYIMNKDLRSGDPKKVIRYLPLIQKLLIATKRNYLISFNEPKRLFRGTKFPVKLIESLEKGKMIMNSSFWSTSKTKHKAEGYLYNINLSNNNFMRVLLVVQIKTKRNIDLDVEKISDFDIEKEVLVFPFCFFSVTDIIKRNLYYEIYLDEIDVPEKEGRKEMRELAAKIANEYIVKDYNSADKESLSKNQSKNFRRFSYANILWIREGNLQYNLFGKEKRHIYSMDLEGDGFKYKDEKQTYEFTDMICTIFEENDDVKKIKEILGDIYNTYRLKFWYLKKQGKI